MQLKLQRSQRAGGVLGKSIIFCLDARADYSPVEAANIAKYKLGSEVVYNSGAAKQHLERMGRQLDRVGGDSVREKALGLAGGIASLALAKMNLNVSIASLGSGHHIECKDLGELLEAETALMEACRSLKQFLAAAATFNGSIILVDFDDGEKVHLSQGALELARLPAMQNPEPQRNSRTLSNPGAHTLEQELDYMAWRLRLSYDRNPGPFHIGASVIASLIILLVFGIHAWSLSAAFPLVGGAIAWTRLS